MKKKLIILIGLIGATITLNAQFNLDSAKAELYQVNKLFDSSRYQGFDVHIVYSTDTIYGKFNYEELDGSYILNEKNIYYKMGDAEFVQNDSFVYNIYHDEKLMMMTRDPVPSKGDLFPLKSFLDSVLTDYDTAYVISMQRTSEFNKISFTAKVDSLPYRYFAIYYDSASYHPYKYEMEFFDGGDESDTVFLVSDSVQKMPFLPQPVKRRITISFSNYHSPNTLEVFDNSNYVYFNRQKRTYEPTENFRAYQLITNGVEADDVKKDTEIFPPPVETPPL